jgi:UDP-N-acetylglucosamine 1-carboxyvinyltransferase
MEKFIVHGGHALEGSVNISGSKNASLPILAATLLTREQCVIRRVPDVSDTNYRSCRTSAPRWSAPAAPS